jgi:hypothetical protein
MLYFSLLARSKPRPKSRGLRNRSGLSKSELSFPKTSCHAYLCFTIWRNGHRKPNVFQAQALPPSSAASARGAPAPKSPRSGVSKQLSLPVSGAAISIAEGVRAIREVPHLPRPFSPEGDWNTASVSQCRLKVAHLLPSHLLDAVTRDLFADGLRKNWRNILASMCTPLAASKAGGPNRTQSPLIPFSMHSKQPVSYSQRGCRARRLQRRPNKAPTSRSSV